MGYLILINRRGRDCNNTYHEVNAFLDSMAVDGCLEKWILM